MAIAWRARTRGVSLGAAAGGTPADLSLLRATMDGEAARLGAVSDGGARCGDHLSCAFTPGAIDQVDEWMGVG
ncbi:hypothetical protein ACWEO2_02200 [Nocardia sp. NPDC004278]